MTFCVLNVQELPKGANDGDWGHCMAGEGTQTGGLTVVTTCEPLWPSGEALDW